MANEFGRAEADAVCPVSLDELGRLYAADEYDRASMLKALPAGLRARLALYCYAKAHMRGLAVMIAATCDEGELEAVGGIAGAALASQANQPPRRAPPAVSTPKTKVSLGGGKLK